MAFERVKNVIDRAAVKVFFPRVYGRTYPRYENMLTAATAEVKTGGAAWARWAPNVLGVGMTGGDSVVQVDVALATAASWIP
jgi:hypothetical protein